MEIGGHIEIEDFSHIDGNDLVILKKILGNFAKNISDTYGEFSLLLVKQESANRISVLLRINNDEMRSAAEDSNMYFALDGALKGIREALDQ